MSVSVGLENRQFIAVGIAELKPAAARKREDRPGDEAAGFLHGGERGAISPSSSAQGFGWVVFNLSIN